MVASAVCASSRRRRKAPAYLSKRIQARNIARVLDVGPGQALVRFAPYEKVRGWSAEQRILV
jgi:hypothetical protein